MTEPTKHNSESNTPAQARQPLRSRLVMIALAILLMAAAVYVVGTSWQAGQQAASLAGPPSSDAPSIPVEAKVFDQAAPPLTYLDAAENANATRSLLEMQALRAYPGAPPVIPHAAGEGQQFGGKSCLQCHEKGDYAPQLEAYAPRVPHPELINCRQCHVAVKTNELFAESDWQTIPPPSIHQTALIGSPPVIPHDLQLRENCLACHAGPGAPPEIRVSHPERVNCRQCHALSQTNAEWSR